MINRSPASAYFGTDQVQIWKKNQFIPTLSCTCKNKLFWWLPRSGSLFWVAVYQRSWHKYRHVVTWHVNHFCFVFQPPPCPRESTLLVLKPTTILTLTVSQTLVHRRDTEPPIPKTLSRDWGLLVKQSRTTLKFTLSHWSPIYPQLAASLSLWLSWRMLCESWLNGAIKSGTSNSA